MLSDSLHHSGLRRTALRHVASALLFALALPALAAGPPDFSGNWKLNTDKGENLGMVKAVTETVTIRQTAAELVMDFTSKFMLQTSTRKVRYDLAGKPVPNEGAMGDKASTTVRWVNGKLVATWAAEGAIPGTQNVKTETRSLSADGKTMTVTNERKGKPAMIMVYDRQ
jgi:hypothetical protein